MMATHPCILSIDTALSACSVAILRGDDVLADLREPLQKGHAERLPPMAAQALHRAGMRVADLDRVAVVAGPGAFAGVRVGLAFARALALGNTLDVVGVGSLAALVAALDDSSLRAAVIDARRGEVYAAIFDAQMRPVAAPFAASSADALRIMKEHVDENALAVAGDGAALLGEMPSHWSVHAASQIDPVIVARLGQRAPSPAAPPSPVYLRAPDAKPASASRFAGLFVDEAP